MSNQVDKDWLDNLLGHGIGLEDGSESEDDKPDTGAYFEINVNNQTDEDGAPLESVDANGDPSIDADEDMDIAEGEVEEAEETVDALEETEETLESFEVAIECAMYSDNGISAESLKFMMIGLEGRINLSELYLPSVESFAHGRINPSNEALSKIRKAVAGAKSAIQMNTLKVIRRLQTWFKATIGQAIGLKKRADKTLEIAKKSHGEPEAKTFDFKGIRNICDEKGQPFSPKDSLKKIDLLKDIAAVTFDIDANTGDKWLEKADKGLDSFIKEMEEAVNYMQGSTENFTWAIENGEADEDLVPHRKFEKVWEGIEKAVGDKVQANKVFTKKADPSDKRFEGVNVKHTDVLPGGKMVYKLDGLTEFNPSQISSKKKRKSLIKRHFGAHAIGVDNYLTTKTKTPKKGTVETLSLNEVVMIADKIQQIMRTVADSQASWEKRYTWYETVNTRYKNKIKEVKNNETLKKSSPHRKAVLAYIQGIADMQRRRSRGSAEVANYLVKTLKTYNYYCTRSLAHYSTANQEG